MTPCILVLNSPNLNLLGTREPATYGHETLADISRLCAATAAERSLAVEFRQTNHDGELLDWIHKARGRCAGIQGSRTPRPGTNARATPRACATCTG